jgi:hypothetical protein
MAWSEMEYRLRSQWLASAFAEGESYGKNESECFSRRE